MADKDQIARKSFLDQLGEWIVGHPVSPEQLATKIRRKLTPSPASTMPAVDRALGKLRAHEPDASEMVVGEMSWRDPDVEDSAATAERLLKTPDAAGFGNWENTGLTKVDVSPAYAAMVSERGLEKTLRHELEHARQFRKGYRSPVDEDEAYAVATEYAKQRGMPQPGLGDLWELMQVRELTKLAGR